MKCLSFWFHMYGAHIGQLNVYMKVGQSFGNPVWSRYGTHGDRWINALIPMSNKSPYMIIFEAVRGSSYAGDIAIDDISLSKGQCTPSVSCDFESPFPALQLCGWKNLKAGDNFDWSYGQGATSSISTGPANDHTLGDKRGKWSKPVLILVQSRKNLPVRFLSFEKLTALK